MMPEQKAFLSTNGDWFGSGNYNRAKGKNKENLLSLSK